MSTIYFDETYSPEVNSRNICYNTFVWLTWIEDSMKLSGRVNFVDTLKKWHHMSIGNKFMLIIERFEITLSHAKGLFEFANLLFKWNFVHSETYIANVLK